MPPSVNPRIEPHAPTPTVPDEDWAQVWFTLVRRGWNSLALVPATPDVSTLRFAWRLAEVARAYQEGSARVLDAEGAMPGDVDSVLAAVGPQVAGVRVLVAVGSPLVHTPSIPLARGCDGALLVVPLGAAKTADARRTLAVIGPEHFVGSVTVRGR